MAYVLPLSDLLRRFGLLDTLAGIILAETAATAPLAVFVFFAYLAVISRDSEEAARLDGAGMLETAHAGRPPGRVPDRGCHPIVLFVLDWNQLLIPLS